ncbi:MULTISPECIES: hypothetical protein [Rhizobium/Agrobacterium group]|uniref:hypothetical protein n=1 Tax=Rhizobium/Agrobacterium group TaxID=227290 RepID=UPI001ADBB0DC|nr:MULTISPECIES: hypothetical protein [Rhizobium/Agrobacterium group]MBO9111794.1 hypothetical protein [Agrobacterium sp. S2/73]QXZ76722.1 hypothetical protein J5276_29460 [Agrobacterium sp. S7/73]QYA17112.1 hypothetical protein J5284_31070 [Rhizobium sp. AB2/73]UEQ85315.1 hypothetical protein I8E17_32985 [Rhizobium sp. AB2/73]
MRAYVLGSMMLWSAFFLIWYLLTLYTASNDLEEIRPGPAGATVMSASRCGVELAALLAMGDKLLKAGGPEVPADLRANIEHCISLDAASRDALMKTQLIRFFPAEK